MNITIYSRQDCHLCEEVLLYLQSKKNLIVENIDVDSDIELIKMFGELIPVILIDGKTIYAPIDFTELDKLITL
jgi:glutaredoxin